MFRATFPTKCEGQQNLLAIAARYVLLAAEGEVAAMVFFQRRKDRVAATDELMQSKCKRLSLRLGMRLAVTAREQPTLNGRFAIVAVEPDQATELLCYST
jgi:hypothetical protein